MNVLLCFIDIYWLIKLLNRWFIERYLAWNKLSLCSLIFKLCNWLRKFCYSLFVPFLIDYIWVAIYLFIEELAILFTVIGLVLFLMRANLPQFTTIFREKLISGQRCRPCLFSNERRFIAVAVWIKGTLRWRVRDGEFGAMILIWWWFMRILFLEIFIFSVWFFTFIIKRRMRRKSLLILNINGPFTHMKEVCVYLWWLSCCDCRYTWPFWLVSIAVF